MQHLQRNVTTGVQAVTYVLFTIVVIGFVLLSDFNNESEFKGTLIFFAILFASFFVLMFIAYTDVLSKQLGGKGSAKMFFLQDTPILSFVMWVPIGIFGALGVALLAQNMGLNPSDTALVSIGGSGAVMMIIFFITKSILIPTIIHGSFNTLVIAIREGIINQITLGSTVPIPEVGLTVSQFNSFATDTLFQFFLVAPAEEFLKVGIIFFVIISLKGTPNEGITKYVGGFFALVVWTMYHAIQAV